MNIEGFLRFWSHYNILIIEVLIGLILITVVYLAFRSFFGAEEATADGLPSELKSADLERTLQRPLEKQDVEAHVPVADTEVAPAEGASSEDLEALKSQLAERDQEIQKLKESLSKVEAEATSPEKKAQEERIKDLEARLAEYEIISEDIADLSFYKEENAKMQSEIANLKAEIESLKSGQPAPVESTDETSSEATVMEETPVAAEAPAEAQAPMAPSTEEEAAALESIFAETAETVASFETSLEPSNIEMTPEANEMNEAVEAALGDVDLSSLIADAEATVASAEENPSSSEAKKEEDVELMNQFTDFVKKGENE